MIELRYATAADVLALTGPLPMSCRGVVAVEDGAVIGLAGLYVDQVSARQVLFMEIKPKLRRHPRVLLKGWRIILRWMLESGLPTHATCDDRIEKAQRFLEHLGFRRIQQGVFAWQKP